VRDLAETGGLKAVCQRHGVRSDAVWRALGRFGRTLVRSWRDLLLSYVSLRQLGAVVPSRQKNSEKAHRMNVFLRVIALRNG
jgi:hypothetical protein